MWTQQRDIEYLNQKVLLFVAQLDERQTTTRFLAIHPSVGRHLKHASANGCRAAITCGIPLVSLQEQIVADLTDTQLLSRRSGALRDDLPEGLVEINFLALALAQRLTWTKPHLAALYFSLEIPQLEVIADVGTTDIQTYATRCPYVVQIRGGASPALWERIMIGEKIGGPRGARLSHDAALLSLDAQTAR
jgi:hypothetical protein